jgi:hypothetical protein
MRFATPCSAMKAMTSRRPAHLGHSSTSRAKTLRSNSAQGTRVRGVGRAGAGTPWREAEAAGRLGAGHREQRSRDRGGPGVVARDVRRFQAPVPG